MSSETAKVLTDLSSVKQFNEKINLIFDTLIIDKKENNDGKITAVIPVRKGSMRCKNKNIRNFGDTNLLKFKIVAMPLPKKIDKKINAGTKYLEFPIQPSVKNI